MQDLPPYQQRVLDEKRELDYKIERLSIFLNSDIYRLLPPDEASLLYLQRQAMQLYSDLLGTRIRKFRPSTPID